MDLHFIVLFLSFAHIPRICGAELCSSTFPHGWASSLCLSQRHAWCSYSCDDGYEKNTYISYVQCSFFGLGTWPTNYEISDLCKLKHCPSNILNGNLSTTCTREVESICGYICNDGYQNKTGVPTITCQTSTNWSVDTRTLCTNDKQCPLLEIPHGDLQSSCTRNPGEICNFTCKEGYQRSQFSELGKVKCTSSSTWDRSFLELCEKIVCPSTIPNGNIPSACTREYNSYCSGYQCDRGYQSPMSMPTLHCNASGQWNWDRYNNDKPCLQTNSPNYRPCPSSIPNGRLSYDCRRSTHEVCDFDCNAGCYKQITSLTCTSYGLWNLDYMACRCQDQTSTTASSNLCPATIPNGRMLNGCDRSYYSVCGFVCDTGCHSLKSTLTCSGYGSWYYGNSACYCPGKTTDSVSSIRCPSTIPNGVIRTSYGCDFTPFSMCSFICYSSCYSSLSVLQCGEWGTWTMGNTACTCDSITTTTTEEPSDESRVGLSAAIASVVGTLILVAIVMIYVCLIRRMRRKQTAYQGTTTGSTWSTSNSGAQSGTASSGYQITDFQQTAQGENSVTPSAPTQENIYIQAPPTYDTIFALKPVPNGPLPSYEEVTAHPSNFNVEL